MNKQSQPIIHILCWLILILAGISVNAQKLPNLQKESLKAPANIKVDGKATEWGNQLQAYNSATEVFYTMANSNDALYLIIQANDPNIINRIAGGGITLSIQIAGSKNDKGAPSVTYPVMETTPYFNLRKKKNMPEDTTAKTADSLMRHNNDLLTKSCKWIRVKNIPGVDTLLSVYNTDGIKLANAFNNKKVYTCELSINLKLLNISIEGTSKFAYHIRINGLKSAPSFSVISSTPGNEAYMQSFIAKANEFGAQQSAPTDFWGDYKLIR